MNLYKVGKVVSIGKTYIIHETNNVGTIIYVARPKQFTKNTDRKIFIYEHKSDYSESIYGFGNFKERILFENLLKVSGVGPKTAINILRDGPERPTELIASADAHGLSQYPAIGLKTANQIILQLKDLYKNLDVIKKGMISPTEVSSPLKTLGFNNRQIKHAVDNLKPNKSIEILVEEAIKLISNASFS